MLDLRNMTWQITCEKEGTITLVVRANVTSQWLANSDPCNPLSQHCSADQSNRSDEETDHSDRSDEKKSPGRACRENGKLFNSNGDQSEQPSRNQDQSDRSDNDVRDNGDQSEQAGRNQDQSDRSDNDVRDNGDQSEQAGRNQDQSDRSDHDVRGDGDQPEGTADETSTPGKSQPEQPAHKADVRQGPLELHEALRVLAILKSAVFGLLKAWPL